MDTVSAQDGAQGADVITLDIQAILAGSSLMKMISEGHVSRDVLNLPIVLTGLGEIPSQQSYQAI